MSSGGAGSKDALSAALRFLSLRPRSVKEIVDRLRKKGFNDAEVERVTGRLLSVGLLDDERFASFLAGSRARVKNWGGRKIAAELASKGVSDEFIKKALSSPEIQGEAERAEAALGKWLKSRGLKPPLERKNIEKAYRHLIGRGFPSSTVMRTIGRQKEGEE